MSSTASQPSITLFRGCENAPRYTMSPFVNKLEARLRFSNISYRKHVGSPVSAPRGKIPYVQMNTEGQPDEALGDSRLIIDSLVQRGTIRDLSGKLSPVEKAADLSVRALLEDKVYYYGVHERWIRNYYTMRQSTMGFLPWPVQVLAGHIAYRGILQTLYGQGTGRYTLKEMNALSKEAWDSINALVVDAQKASTSSKSPDDVFWLLKGDEPTEADATLFGFISSSLVCPAAPQTGALVRSYPAILEYARRIHERYFADYDHWNEVL